MDDDDDLQLDGYEIIVSESIIMKGQATYPTMQVRASQHRGIMEGEGKGEHAQISEYTYTSRCQGKSTMICVSKYGGMILSRKYPADHSAERGPNYFTLLTKP